jgi:hypothetical protein
VSSNAPIARGRDRHAYWLTPAGEALRPVLAALGLWGLAHTRDRIKPIDLDPVLLTWGFRKRAIAHIGALPDHRVVVRFEFSGVPTSRTKFRVMWLLLGRVDVCLKDPGFEKPFVPG